MPQALAAAQAIGAEWHRAEALTGLAPHLPVDLQPPGPGRRPGHQG